MSKSTKYSHLAPCISHLAACLLHLAACLLLLSGCLPHTSTPPSTPTPLPTITPRSEPTESTSLPPTLLPTTQPVPPSPSPDQATALRMTEDPDDALMRTRTWVDRHTEPDDVVITEESIGVFIDRPYCKMHRAAACAGVARYVVVYESHTQRPPEDPLLSGLIASGTELASMTGFKETITIIGLPAAGRSSAGGDR